ncbi:MAG: hypothetical protein P4L92_02600 [Rudaea sp.]|nr:hypothetical protein [Rudaea sp.]
MQRSDKPARTRLYGTLMLMIAAPAAANDFALSPVFAGASFRWEVSVDGGAVQQNPTLTLIRGQTYTFEVTGLAPIHSFYIKTISGTGSLNAYTGGGLSISGGITSDTLPGMPITFTVPQTAPDMLFYNCGLHASMAGTIMIDGIFQNGFETPPTQ